MCSTRQTQEAMTFHEGSRSTKCLMTIHQIIQGNQWSVDCWMTASVYSLVGIQTDSVDNSTHFLCIKQCYDTKLPVIQLTF